MKSVQVVPALVVFQTWPVPAAAPVPTVTEEKKPATDQWVEEQKPKATGKKKRKAA